MENTNKPRDFFLHVSAFVLLYFVAIAATILLFTLIDYRFPDSLASFYGDPYSGPVRFAIASLIILSPIFAVLMHTIQKEARIAPARAQLGVRKWLTYITLFLAGATVIVDLITLLNSFLGGALATAFALKALTLMTIAGAGFGYFFLDLRGYWQSHIKESQYARIAFLASVALSIVVGFATLGSPATQRDLRFDAERLSSLSMIQGQVVMYWQQNQKLPDSLEELNNPLYGFSVPTDPADRETPYSYEKKGDLSFELCATFARESSGQMMGEYYPMMQGLKNANEWQHDAGTQCFQREIDTDLIKPIDSPDMFPTKEVIPN